MPAAIPDLDAPIVPGESAAGIFIGSNVESLLAHSSPSQTAYLEVLTVYTFPSVKVWVAYGVVHQIGVYCGYRGLLERAVGIGSTIAAVEEQCGCRVEEDEDDNLATMSRPGWCFDTTLGPETRAFLRIEMSE